MPHVTIKLWPGRSEQAKARLADEVTRAVVASLRCGEEAISVGIEDVRPEDWAEKVYKPDILGNAGRMYKKPGYDPLR